MKSYNELTEQERADLTPLLEDVKNFKIPEIVSYKDWMNTPMEALKLVKRMKEVLCKNLQTKLKKK